MSYSPFSHGGQARTSTLIVDSDIDLSGFDVITGGGDIDTVGGSLYTGGGEIATSGGEITGRGNTTPYRGYDSLIWLRIVSPEILANPEEAFSDTPTAIWGNLMRLPKMTSAIAPRGVVTASTELPNTAYQAFRAFTWSITAPTTYGWHSAALAITDQYLQYEYDPSDVPLNIYGVVITTALTNHARTPTSIKLQGSDDGIVWDDIKTWSIPLPTVVVSNAYLLDYPLPSRPYMRAFFAANHGDANHISLGRLQIIGL